MCMKRKMGGRKRQGRKEKWFEREGGREVGREAKVVWKGGREGECNKRSEERCEGGRGTVGFRYIT